MTHTMLRRANRPDVPVERRSLTRRNDLEEMVQDAIGVVSGERAVADAEAAAEAAMAALDARAGPGRVHDARWALYRRLKDALGIKTVAAPIVSPKKASAAKARAELFGSRAA